MKLGHRLIVAGIALTLGATAWASAAGDPDPDRYIVSFYDHGKGKAALRASGARVVLDLPRHEAAAARIPARALKGLRRNPNIEFIEPDPIRVPMAQTTPWGIPAVQADLVTYNAASGLTVCIIDSGYSLGHEDLQSANVTASPDPGTGDPFFDGSHHGTHVAGTIAALSNGVGVVGVVPGGDLNLHIVKVFGNSGTWAYSSTLVAALDKCETEGGAEIVSMSLGGSFKSRTEQRAFDRAYTRGVLSIAAAGNDGNPVAMPRPVRISRTWRSRARPSRGLPISFRCSPTGAAMRRPRPGTSRRWRVWSMPCRRTGSPARSSC